MDPLDRLAGRVDSIIDRVERGEAVDFDKESQLAALDVARAGVHYTKQAVAANREADLSLLESISQEDSRLNG